MKQLLVIVISVFIGSKLLAQSFEVSTADAPRWYVIQVTGSNDNAGKVVTETDGRISGQPLANGLAAKSRQLWRFEAAPDSKYEIINRYSGKKLDVYYDADLGERIATASETPSTVWTISAISDYYTLRIVTQPAGGVSGAGYLTQGGDDLNSALYFTKANAGGADAKFRFISADAPVISNADETVWFSIRSAKSALAGKCITEVETTGDIKLSLRDFTAGNHRQQWKIVSNPDAEGSVNLVNRETGNRISTVPVYGIYNYIQYAATETAGWQIDPLGSNQYQVYTGAAGLEKYWNAATDGETRDNYPADAGPNTGFAWEFRLVDEPLPVEIVDQPERGDPVVLVKDRRISVNGDEQFRVYTIQGTGVNKYGELPQGIYLVTVKNKTIKVLVK